jgi:hypothetical protein
MAAPHMDVQRGPKLLFRTVMQLRANTPEVVRSMFVQAPDTNWERISQAIKEMGGE